MRINYVGIVAAAVVYWLLGALWYGVVFKTRWLALEGFRAEQMPQREPVAPYIIAFIASLIIAYLLAHACVWRNANTAGKGAAVGVLFWIGFVATTSFTTYLFEMRPKELFLINYGYSLVGMFIMGAILGTWKKKAA